MGRSHAPPHPRGGLCRGVYPPPLSDSRHVALHYPPNVHYVKSLCDRTCKVIRYLPRITRLPYEITRYRSAAWALCNAISVHFRTLGLARVSRRCGVFIPLLHRIVPMLRLARRPRSYSLGLPFPSQPTPFAFLRPSTNCSCTLIWIATFGPSPHA